MEYIFLFRCQFQSLQKEYDYPFACAEFLTYFLIIMRYVDKVSKSVMSSVMGFKPLLARQKEIDYN